MQMGSPGRQAIASGIEYWKAGRMNYENPRSEQSLWPAVFDVVVVSVLSDHYVPINRPLRMIEQIT
jgi:hypothetical protein